MGTKKTYLIVGYLRQPVETFDHITNIYEHSVGDGTVLNF